MRRATTPFLSRWESQFQPSRIKPEDRECAVAHPTPFALLGENPSIEGTASSRSPDVFDILHVGRAACLGPHWAEVDQLAFQAFDLEPQCRAAGKNQRDHPSRGVALVELDREQIKDCLPVLA